MRRQRLAGQITEVHDLHRFLRMRLRVCLRQLWRWHGRRLRRGACSLLQNNCILTAQIGEAHNLRLL